jgi:hypothetical protein
MPTMTLTVDGSGSGTLGWGISGAASTTAALASDDGTSTSGSSYVSSNSASEAFLGISFTDPTVAESAIASITSVRFVAKGRRAARGPGGTDVLFTFNTPSGFAETINFAGSISYVTRNGTTRTAQPDSSAWDYSSIEGLELDLEKSDTVLLHLSYLAMEVVYVAVAARDNAVFFGTNF